MNFTCDKDTLLNTINIVSKAVSTKSTMSLQECILVTVEEDGFKLLANDLQIAIESNKVICNVKETGSIALDARIFSEIIRRLPENTLTIKTNDNFVTIIKSGKAEFKLLGLSSEDFSVLPIVEKNNEYIILSQDLRTMIKQTLFAVATENPKIALTGELLDIKDNIINIVAVDGFRVALRKTKLQSISEDTSVVIPAKTMNEISKILQTENESKVHMYFTDKHALFEMNSCIIVSRVLNGDFINYEQVFTEDFDTIIYLNKTELISALERSLIMAKDSKKNPVKLNMNNNTLEITSNNEMGTTYDELAVDMEGKPLEIAFNPKFLIDSIKVIEEEKISIQFTTALSPCIIKGIEAKNVDIENHKHLILPLRIRS